MRKYINTLFMGLLIAASITSCSEEQDPIPEKIPDPLSLSTNMLQVKAIMQITILS
ncbi:hypothetical protein NXX20_00010 [Bacteroides stercoris]|nr:hypothetical protein [Bacteroides stercoris]